MVEKRGKLFVIEGTDGSGKETQTEKIAERLNKNGICITFNFPRYETPTGEIIKRHLGKPPYEQEFGPSNLVDPKIASTWYALDRLVARPEINSALELGFQVFCNRYVESNMGHQGGKIRDAEERKKFIDWVDRLEYGSLKLPKPDKVFFLYMPHQVASELRVGRVERRAVQRLDGHEGDPEHMKNAEQAYLELADRFGWKRIDCAPDGTRASLRSIEDISDELYKLCLNEISKKI